MTHTQAEMAFEKWNPSGRGRPILLVEDNEMDVDLCLAAFEENKVTNPTVICRDGEEALRYIEIYQNSDDKNLPILVLLDLNLPRADGIEVLKMVKSHPVWRKVPVTMMTTSREQGDLHRAYEGGVNAYVVKPIDFGRFGEVVNNIKRFWLHTNEAPYGVV